MGMSRISALFTADTSGLQSGASRASAAMRQMRGSAGSLEASMTRLTRAINLNTFIQFGQIAAQAVGSLGRALAPAIKDATSLGEELSKSAQIFGDNAGEIDKFAKSAAALGMTRVQALEAAGSFGNMFTSMKLGTDQSAEMSLTFTKLASDLASFNNASVDEAITALGATLRGESEPIRKFGVLLDDATLKAKAFELGMTKSAKDAMTPAIKAQAAYAAVLEQTAKAQGDFARTSGGLANMGRILKAEAGNAAATLGTAFVPVLEAFGAGVVKVFQDIQPMIQEAANWLIEAWNKVGPAVIETSLDAAELFARGFDIVAGILGRAFEYARDVFNYFGGLMPDWSGSIDWFAVGVEAFQRAISLFEGLSKAFQAGMGYIISGIIKAAQFVWDAATWALKALGLNVSELEAASRSMGAVAESFWDSASKKGEEALALTANAFSDKFVPTKAAKDAAKIMTEGFEGGMEDAIEKLRAGSGAAKEIAKISSENLGAKIGGAVIKAADNAAKAAGIDRWSTEGSNLIASMINGTGGLERKQLTAMEKVAENTGKLLEEGFGGLEAVTI